MLEADEAVITKKTSAIAIMYKEKCLVDKSKTDAVKMYLTYQIEQSRNQGRPQEVLQLEQDLCLLFIFNQSVRVYF